MFPLIKHPAGGVATAQPCRHWFAAGLGVGVADLATAGGTVRVTEAARVNVGGTTLAVGALVGSVVFVGTNVPVGVGADVDVTGF